MQPALNSGDRIAVSQYYQKIETILNKCALTDSLLMISQVSQEIFAKEDYWLNIGKERIHPWVLAFAARTLIKVSGDRGRDRIINDEDMMRITECYYKCLDPVLGKLGQWSPLFVLNTTYEQFYWQERIRHYLPRYLLIFSPSDGDTDAVRTIKREFDETLLHLVGLKYEQYLRLTMLVWCTMRRTGRFRWESLLNGEIEHFRDTVTCRNVNRCAGTRCKCSSR
jgi:hypothetical protein